MLNRRECLMAGAVGFGLSQWRWPDCYAQDSASPARHGLLVRTETPFNAEPPLKDLLTSYLTPVEHFFVRNHGSQPRIDVKDFRLTIEGEVERPQTFTLAELIEKFPRTSVTATVTCAGNRRTEFAAEKAVPGVPWEAGAIGNAEWSGVKLADVLKHCGLKAEARHVWFDSTDQIMAMGQMRTFGGSIPLATALEADTAGRALLADQMNGKPLTPEHGFPLRSLVPGYIGARSVKWLSKITVSPQPSSNFYLAQTYKLVKENIPENVAAAPPIFEYLTNSAICEVRNEANGKTVVRGYALAAGRRNNRVTDVSLTVDGGQHWQSAKIVSPVRDYAWTLWSAELDLPSGEHRLQVRATDAEGVTQPIRSLWNAQGYQFNGWHSVKVP